MFVSRAGDWIPAPAPSAESATGSERVGAVELLRFAVDVTGSVCGTRPTSLTPALSQPGGARACCEEPAGTCWPSLLLGETVSGCSSLAFGCEMLQEANYCSDFYNCGKIHITLATSLFLSARFCRAATTTVPRTLSSSTPKP